MLDPLSLPELLIPAGDEQSFAAALRYGADAIYLGGTQFGMRAAAHNFDAQQLEQAVALAHAQGVRVYLTCNTLPRNAELPQLPAFLRHAAACGVDAFILSDLGVLAMAKKLAPDVEIHISTQAGIVNFAAANACYELGASRVVLARELSLEEISEIREKTDSRLQLECFVHGAMCLSFSGRCYLSEYMTGRDANRGDCAQPCRWHYALVEEKRPGQYFPVEQGTQGTYLLNAKDLCMIEYLPQLIQAGISSFKIEGRAKSAYYTAVVTNAYRCALNEYQSNPGDSFQASPWIVEEMERVSHRAYCTGFYFDKPHETAHVQPEAGYLRTWEVSAIADRWENGRLFVTQRNRFFEGDELEVMEAGKPPFSVRVQAMRDGGQIEISAAPHPMMPLSFLCSRPVEAGALLRRRTDGGNQ